jgi:hypothetical protein
MSFMRRSLAVALLSFFIPLCGYAHAQEESWNLRTSPLSLLVGTANLRLDYRLGGNWMIGPEIEGLNHRINGVKVRAGALGVYAVYHFAGVFADGAYLDFGARAARFHASGTDSSGAERHADMNDSGLRVLGGYHWFWLPFNLNLGAGLVSNSIRRIAITDASGKEVNHVDVKRLSLALDFSLGYAF